MEAFPSRVSYGGILGPLARQNARVQDLERLLLKQPQVDMLTQSLVHGGMCARWIFVPAGTALTGATTKLENLCIVIGDIDVTTERGPMHLQGFNVLPASPGAKRAGVARADTWWATVWRTDLTDAEAVENEMTDEAANLQTRRAGIEWAKRPELEN